MSDDLSKEMERELEELRRKQAKELEEFEQNRRERLKAFDTEEQGALEAFEKQEAAEVKAFEEEAKREFVIKIDRNEYRVNQPTLTGGELRNLPTPPIGPDRDLFEVVLAAQIKKLVIPT